LAKIQCKMQIAAVGYMETLDKVEWSAEIATERIDCRYWSRNDHSCEVLGSSVVMVVGASVKGKRVENRQRRIQHFDPARLLSSASFQRAPHKKDWQRSAESCCSCEEGLFHGSGVSVAPLPSARTPLGLIQLPKGIPTDSLSFLTYLYTRLLPV
jgi:hypothetical protein